MFAIGYRLCADYRYIPAALSTRKKLSPNPNFTGEVWLAPLSEQKELNVPMSNVTFEPGCRNSWHSHKAGQMLIATAGVGYYQEKGNRPDDFFREILWKSHRMLCIGTELRRTVGLPMLLLPVIRRRTPQYGLNLSAMNNM